MPAKTEVLIKRFDALAERFEKKGKREWAYAKNDLGDNHYGRARNAFAKAKQNREKAEALRRKAQEKETA